MVVRPAARGYQCVNNEAHIYYVIFSEEVLELYQNTSVCMAQKGLRIPDLQETDKVWHIRIRKCYIVIIIDVVGKNVEQLELSYTAGKNVNWGNHFGDFGIFY